MRAVSRVIAVILWIASYMLTPGAALAGPLRLGVPYGVVRAAFTNAKQVRGGGRRILEVRAPHFAGLVWRKADFAFDIGDHLASVTFSTRGDTFAHIEKLMAAELAEADAAPPGEAGLAQDAQGDVQIRICEMADGAIAVTFERTAI